MIFWYGIFLSLLIRAGLYPGAASVVNILFIKRMHRGASLRSDTPIVQRFDENALITGRMHRDASLHPTTPETSLENHLTKSV